MSPGMMLAAGVLGVVLLVVLWRLLRRQRPPSWIQETICPQCGWKGRTSRYAGRCPRCNAPIGDRKAGRVPEGR